MFGLAYGGVMPLYAIVVREYFGARIMGATFGAVAFASTLGMALGPWAGGWLYDSFGSYSWLFIASFGIGLGAVAIAFTFRPPRPVPAPRCRSWRTDGGHRHALHAADVQGREVVGREAGAERTAIASARSTQRGPPKARHLPGRRSAAAHPHRHHRAARSGKAVTTDGPFAETKEQLAGYSILEAKNLDEALEIATDTRCCGWAATRSRCGPSGSCRRGSSAGPRLPAGRSTAYAGPRR